MTALLFGGAQAIADSAVDPACIEAVTQKVSSTPVDEHVGLIQPLEKPHPINLKFEIFALSYPRGRQNGPLYHIRVRQDMLTQMVAMEGENFKKETTEYNSATDSLLSTLGYRVEIDPRLGYFFSQQPSPELLSKLSQEWNAKVDASKRLHVNFKTTGADEQLTMLKLWLDRFTIGVADPFKGFEEFYIPNGSAPPSEQELYECVINPSTGRAYERNGLYFHDAAQVINSLHLPLGPLQKTQRLSQFWKDLYDNLHARRRAGVLTRKVGGPLVEKYIQALRSAHSPLRGQVDEAAGTMDEYTLFRINLHHSMRGLHSITHILSWLILSPNGFLPGVYSPSDRGATVQQEFIIHVAGLGVKGPQSVPPGASPNLVLNFAEAKVTDQPLTLQQAYDYITNGDIRRARQLVELLNDRQVTEIYNRHVRQGTFNAVNAQTIEQWTTETRTRYRGMTLEQQ